MTEITVDVQIQPQHADYDAIRRAVTQAEEIGVDTIFGWDHFFPLRGDPDGRHFEAWTTLGAWAEQTDSVEIGCLVTCNSYRNPDLLADMARTVDHISGGRLILGIGAGWFKKDYDEFGYDFKTPGGRLADLAGALPRIESRLSKGNPPPTRKIPLLIGGGGERKTLRLAAQYADIWHAFGDPGTMARKNEILDMHCGDVGRDPSEIQRSVGVGSRSIDVADDYLDVGTTRFTVEVSGPDYDLGSVAEWIAFRDEHL